MINVYAESIPFYLTWQLSDPLDVESHISSDLKVMAKVKPNFKVKRSQRGRFTNLEIGLIFDFLKL